MASYSVFIRRSAEKEIISIPKADRVRIISRIRCLAKDPKPHGHEKLKSETTYRVRQGDYRIVYTIDDKNSSVIIEKIGHRREVYR